MNLEEYTSDYLDKFQSGVVQKYNLFDLVLRRVDDYMEIESIAILPKNRGKGVGSKAVTEIEQFCKLFGYSGVVLHSAESARGFYRKIGYTAVKSCDTMFKIL